MLNRAVFGAMVLALICVGCGDSKKTYMAQSDGDKLIQVADGKAAPKAEKSTRSGNKFGNYIVDRCKDFVDMLDISIGGGYGLLAHARATKIAQAGGGYSNSWRLGFRGRNGGVFHEVRREVGISLLTWTQTDRESIWGNIEKAHADKLELDTLDKGDRAFFGIGGTAHGVLVVADANFRPVELFDFILGLFTIDILDDDGQPSRVSQL